MINCVPLWIPLFSYNVGCSNPNGGAGFPFIFHFATLKNKNKSEKTKISKIDFSQYKHKKTNVECSQKRQTPSKHKGLWHPTLLFGSGIQSGIFGILK